MEVGDEIDENFIKKSYLITKCKSERISLSIAYLLSLIMNLFQF